MITPVEASRRSRGHKHSSMFLRMLVRAAILRRGRAMAALFAMVVAAAVATAMLNLFVDVQAQLRNEFRNYGANVIVAAKNGQQLPANALKTVESTLAGHAIAAPFAYAVAKTSAGEPVVVAGTDFARVRALDHWWSVTAWPAGTNQALVGKTAARIIGGKTFDLNFAGHSIHLTEAGTVITGAAEDSRVYIPLADFESWTGVRPSTIEIAASGSVEELQGSMQKLAAALPSAEVRPVRQLIEGETRVLGKTRSTLLASSILIVVTASLCVLATLIGWVFDRRRDFAIMKALGASERLLTGFFAAEASALGAVGAVLGFAGGVDVAAWIGRVNFHAVIAPRFSIFPLVLAGSVAVALLAAVVPISLLRRVQPATILRGE
jgi:putative ABC transport system permease protein